MPPLPTTTQRGSVEWLSIVLRPAAPRAGRGSVCVRLNVHHDHHKVACILYMDCSCSCHGRGWVERNDVIDVDWTNAPSPTQRMLPLANT